MRIRTLTLTLLAALGAAALLASSCGDDDDGTPATGTPTETAATASPGPSESASPTASIGTGTPGATSTPAVDYSCDPVSGGDDDIAMFVKDVRVAGHEGYDRITFELEVPEGQTAGVPHYEIDFTDPPLIKDPSGEEIEVAGEAFLGIILFASGVDLSTDTPREVYTGPDTFQPGDTQVIEELALAGDFEAIMTWYAGLSREACFHITTLEDPARIVVDIEAP